MIVLGYKTGQLGNRLFLYAHFIAYAIKNNDTIFCPSFDEYEKYFKNLREARYPLGSNQKWFISKRYLFFYKIVYIIARLLGKKYIGNSRIKFFYLNPAEEMSLSSSEFISLKNSTEVCVVKGWLYRDVENFQFYAEQIREHFSICGKHEKNVDHLIFKARELGDIVVGVHMRRGDYRYFEGGKYYYSNEDYKKIMKEFENLHSNNKVCWVICSNETINIEEFKNFTCIEGNGQIVEDMYSFAKCDYIIGPPSTYTAWASFYGKCPLYQIHDLSTKISMEKFVVVNG